LKAARIHDRPVRLAEDQIPNREIRISEEFLQEHEALLSAIGQALVNAGLATAGAVDSDLREAVAALIRTHRTLASGLYYQSLPDNVLAANIFRGLQSGIDAFRRQETEQLGMSRTRDADVLAVLVFFERLGLDRNNGRRRGRAFLDFLKDLYPVSGGAADAGLSSSLLVG
jgi:hypothetical protein